MGNLITKIQNICENTLTRYRSSIPQKRYIEDVALIKEALLNIEPTQTDFILIRKLLEVYSPANRGFSTNEEIELIKSCLQLDRRTILQLRNLRNTVVMMLDDSVEAYDKMSAIVGVIDCQIFDCGGEV